VQQPNPGERWVPIPGYEEHSEVSDLGRVRSIDRVLTWKNGRRVRHRGRYLKLCLSNSGYFYVHLTVARKGKSKFIHSLVLEAFIGPRPEGMEGCHNNGDRLDNRRVNLRWDTHAENVRDTARHGRDAKRNRTHCPRSHLLSAPNLVPSSAAKGYRSCWACSKAADYGRYCRAYGKPFDFQAEADQYYRRIMAGDTGNRHKKCPRGHRLEHPNLAIGLAAKDKKACLACRRMQNNAQDAKRAGRPFDFQAAADRHYERIMAAAA
jgi:hypothetical protein